MRNRDGGWPAGEFREYIEIQMSNAEIPSVAELARRAGIDASLISKWLNGYTQPSRPNLKKVAIALGVPPVNLYLQAGLEDEDDVDISGGHYDLRAIAPVYRELLDFDGDEATSEIERAFIRQAVATLVAGLLVRRAERAAGRPIGRRRSA